MIAVGVMGAGRIGQVHAKSVSLDQRAKLSAVSDAKPEASEALANAYGATVCSNEEIISDPAIDAVIICTPTATHCDLIEAAISAGKAVMCEKPFDMSVDRIRDCLHRISGNKQPLLLGFNRRFDPSFASLQRRLAEGEIGDIEIVTITSRDPAPPPIAYIETSGGIFRDMMIHDFDMARFLLGEEPVDMRAVGSSLVDPAIGKAGDVDTASVMMTTASGKICQISNSRRASYGYDQRIEVHGSKGMLRAGNIHETTVEIANANGFKYDPVMNFFLERYMPAYRQELNHFIDCIVDGQSPTPNGNDGLHAQMLAEAAFQSWKSGETVSIPSD